MISSVVDKHGLKTRDASSVDEGISSAHSRGTLRKPGVVS